MSSKCEPTQNHLLAALSPEVQGRLFPNLEIVPLPLGAIVLPSRVSLHHIYFPTDSIVSKHCLLASGASTAVSVTGNEGLVGLALFLGDGYMCYDSVVESAGFAYRLSTHQAKDEFDRHTDLCMVILRYGHALITQISLTAACNRHHSILQRLCRWLLLFFDRLDNDHLTMTHECISNMLGVRREGVTEAALILQRLGVITYSPGIIRVLDRPQLEALSCECYGVIKRETDVLLDCLPQCRGITDADLPRCDALNTVKRPAESGPQICHPKRRYTGSSSLTGDTGIH
jgi:hypothetical protein